MSAAEERVLELADMSYERAAAVVAELDRLRAELAETRSAGNEVVAAADSLVGGGAADWEGLHGTVWSRLSRAADAWRSVRGDAPTEPPADPQPVNADLRDRLRTYPGDGDRQAPTDTEEQR